MNLQRAVFSRLYRRAPDVESLPWHREEPPTLLAAAIAARPAGGRALDVGCGEGTNVVHLARAGFSVVSLDFVPDAIGFRRPSEAPPR